MLILFLRSFVEKNKSLIDWAFGPDVNFINYREIKVLRMVVDLGKLQNSDYATRYIQYHQIDDISVGS